MRAIFCCANSFRVLSRAAAKAAASRLRDLRLLAPAHDWSARAAVCETCPLRVIECGISYCGRPLLHRIDRDESVDGCGCPTRAKARRPDEHCPIDADNRPARTINGQCACKWCRL